MRFSCRIPSCFTGGIGNRERRGTAGDGSAFPLGEQGEEIQDIRTQREAGHLDTDALCDVVTGGDIHDAEKLPLVLALRKQKISEG